MNLRYGPTTLLIENIWTSVVGTLLFRSFLNFVKDELSFFYFTKLNVLLLPDIDLFKNIRTSTKTSLVGKFILFTLFHNVERFEFKFCKIVTIDAFCNCWCKSKNHQATWYITIYSEIFFWVIHCITNTETLL